MLATTINADELEELAKNSYVLFEKINQERFRLGISALQWDDDIASEAEKHSYWMADTNNYKHSYKGFNECIMVGTNPNNVFNAWCNSPGHYNILIDPEMTRCGIGMGLRLDKIQMGKIKITYNVSAGYSTFMGK